LLVRVTTVGTLPRSLPEGRAYIEGDKLTVKDVLESLLNKYGQTLSDELLTEGRIRDGLSFLLNGRNILSLPNGFETQLKDGDELIIATMLVGG
jgi:molybdopterin converting factor small subunit